MSAKKSRKSAAVTPASHVSAAQPDAGPSAPTTGTNIPAATPWIESADPRKRQIARIVLALVWVYVAALWLLALDQTFDWGIFGPKIPTS